MSELDKEVQIKFNDGSRIKAMNPVSTGITIGKANGVKYELIMFDVSNYAKRGEELELDPKYCAKVVVQKELRAKGESEDLTKEELFDYTIEYVNQLLSESVDLNSICRYIGRKDTETGRMVIESKVRKYVKEVLEQKEEKKARINEAYVAKYPETRDGIKSYNTVDLSTGDILRIRDMIEVAKDENGNYLYMAYMTAAEREDWAERPSEIPGFKNIAFTTKKPLDELIETREGMKKVAELFTLGNAKRNVDANWPFVASIDDSGTITSRDFNDCSDTLKNAMAKRKEMIEIQRQKTLEVRRKEREEREKTEASIRTEEIKRETEFEKKMEEQDAQERQIRIDEAYVSKLPATRDGIKSYNTVDLSTGDILRIRDMIEVAKDENGNYLYMAYMTAAEREDWAERPSEIPGFKNIAFTTKKPLDELIETREGMKKVAELFTLGNAKRNVDANWPFVASIDDSGTITSRDFNDCSDTLKDAMAKWKEEKIKGEQRRPGQAKKKSTDDHDHDDR